ncbi:MAG: hypothetical protein M0Z30_03480 [Actinomycetota bacterium]|nr:hypothetical protein [Actinomycetota bacterium]
MPGSCIHGFVPAECLICRTLGADARPGVVAEVPPVRSGGPDPRTQLSGAAPARPDRIYDSAAAPRRRRRSLGGSALMAVVALLAVGAAIWILAGVVFTVLHLLELIVVAAGAGWVGYRIGHFRGSRRPRPPG